MKQLHLEINFSAIKFTKATRCIMERENIANVVRLPTTNGASHQQRVHHFFSK